MRGFISFWRRWLRGRRRCVLNHGFHEGLLVGGAALVLAGLAFVPVLGYVEALAAPVLALRMRRGGGGRYAGLRILARD